MAQQYPDISYQVRYYRNPKQFDVLGTYYSRTLAYGMRKKFSFQHQFPLSALKVKITK